MPMKIDSGGTILAALQGAVGLPTFPTGAAAANGVSIAEVLRYAQENIVTGTGTVLPTNSSLWGALAGATGVTTWPTKLQYANGVSIAEALAFVSEGVIRGTGTALADNESLADVLYSTNGILTFPVGVAPGNGVSIAEVLRDAWDVLRNGTGGAEPATNRSIMDYLGITPAFFVPGLGYKITKAANVQATADDIFDVTGQVAINLMYGEVTADFDANITTMLLRIKTDNVNLCAATTVTSDADGTMYMFNGDAGSILNGVDIPVLRMANTSGTPLTPLIIGNAGVNSVIEHTLGAADAATGAMTWTVFYMPLEASAAIAASA